MLVLLQDREGKTDPAAVFDVSHVTVRLRDNRGAAKGGGGEDFLLVVQPVWNDPRPIVINTHIRPHPQAGRTGQADPFGAFQKGMAPLVKERIHGLKDARIFVAQAARVVDVVDERDVFVRFDDSPHVLENAHELFLIPMVILRDGLALPRGVLVWVLMPRNLLSSRGQAETRAATIAITELQSRPKIKGPPGIKIETVNIIIADHMFNEVQESLPIGRVPADRAVVFAHIHMLAVGTAARLGPLRVFRIIARDHGPGQFMSGGNIGNDANAPRFGGGNGFAEHVPLAQVRMGGKPHALDGRVLSHGGNAHRIGVHLGHGPGQGLGVVFKLRGKRGLVSVNQKHARGLYPSGIRGPPHRHGPKAKAKNGEEARELF